MEQLVHQRMKQNTMTSDLYLYNIDQNFRKILETSMFMLFMHLLQLEKIKFYIMEVQWITDNMLQMICGF